MPKMYTAFQNDHELKKRVLEWARGLDEKVYPYQFRELGISELGIDPVTLHLLTNVHQEMLYGEKDYKKFLLEFLSAVPVGADTYLVWNQDAVWLLNNGSGSIPPFADEKVVSGVMETIPGLDKVVQDVAQLYKDPCIVVAEWRAAEAEALVVGKPVFDLGSPGVAKSETDPATDMSELLKQRVARLPLSLARTGRYRAEELAADNDATVVSRRSELELAVKHAAEQSFRDAHYVSSCAAAVRAADDGTSIDLYEVSDVARTAAYISHGEKLLELLRAL